MEIQDTLNSTNFTFLFLIFIGLKFTIETYLKVRNINSLKVNASKVPERFENLVTAEEYKKSTDYNLDRLKFQIIVSFVSIFILLLLTIGGLLNTLTSIVSSYTSSNILGAIFLGLLIILISEILEIPLAIYSTFVIEEKYGFNKTTKITDLLIIKGKYQERKFEIDDNFIATKGLAKDLKIQILEWKVFKLTLIHKQKAFYQILSQGI